MSVLLSIFEPCKPFMNLLAPASSDAQSVSSGYSPGIELHDCSKDMFSAEVMELATCFCLHERCRDWFSSVPFATKIEVSLVLRAVAGHLIEPPVAKKILKNLISTVCLNEVGRSLELLTELASKDISIEIGKIIFRWHWTNAEDCALFSALLQGKLALFKWWSKRSSFALRQRFSFWRRTWKRMLFTTQDDVVIVDEEEEVEDNDAEAISEGKSCEEDVPEEESYEETVCGDEEGRNEGISLVQINSCLSSKRSLGKRNVAAALAGKKAKALRKEVVAARCAACRAKKQCLSLTRQAVPPRDDHGIQRASLVQMLANSMKIQNPHGKRYDEEEKKFWISIHSTSPACFDRLSRIFNGPCIRSVISWTEPVKEELRRELFDSNLVTKIAMRWVKIWGGVDDLFTLSYDACKIDEDLSINEAGVVTGVMRSIILDESPLSYRTNPDLYRKLWEKQIETRNLQTHAFVFILTPVSESRGYPIHVRYENTGSATPDVLRCIREIPQKLNQVGIRVAFAASDSDNKYRMQFNVHFGNFYLQFSRIYAWNRATNDIFGLEVVQIPMVKCCNDIPHILKRWRSRMITSQCLFLSQEAESLFQQDASSNCLNAGVIQHLNPMIPQSAFRVGSLPAMDDSYPAMIFTPETLMKAWDCKRFDVFLFLLPAVCAIIVFRNKTISRAIRMQLAYLGLCTCIFYYSYVDDCGQCGLRFRSPIMTKELLVDMSNALLCQICAMCQVPKAFRTSKVSSTMSEHYFARMRRTMGPDCSASNFTNVLIRNVIADLGDSATRDDLSHPRRKFDSALCEEGVSYLDTGAIVEVRDFATAVFQACNMSLRRSACHWQAFNAPNHHDLTDSPIIQLLQQLEKDSGTPRRFTIHAGQSRMRRIYGRSIASRFATSAKVEPHD